MERESKEIRLPVPWGHVAARAYGSSSDFPVLLIHGILDNAGAFHRLVSQQHLPSNFYYVAIDLPGHGLSSHFQAGVPLSFFDYVLAVRYVVESLGWTGKFHLVGHSFGAQLCLFYSLVYPDRVQRMILIDAVYPRVLPNEKVLPWLRKILSEARDETKDDSRTFTRDEVIYSLRWRRRFALKSDAAEAMFDRSVTEIDNGNYRYNRDPRLKSYVLPLFSLDQLVCILSEMRTKTLIIFTHGSLDMLSEKNVARVLTNLVDSVIDAELIFVEGNHDVHNNHPERVAPLISKFFNDLASKL